MLQTPQYYILFHFLNTIYQQEKLWKFIAFLISMGLCYEYFIQIKTSYCCDSHLCYTYTSHVYIMLYFHISTFNAYITGISAILQVGLYFSHVSMYVCYYYYYIFLFQHFRFIYMKMCVHICCMYRCFCV